LERSLQAKIVVPMAVSLAFGILFATVITLVLIPALYVILEDVKKTVPQAFNSFGRAIRSYALFDQPDSRREFWQFFWVHIALLLVLLIVDGIVARTGLLPMGVIALSYLFAMTLPITAAICRRLVDLEWSRWWALLLIIPLLGFVVLLIMTLFPGKHALQVESVNEAGDLSHSPVTDSGF
ncbi:DUF805 domain-containing protein, partial [Arsukibacterium sp.]|uniref:DUF805 domain-containing protein n=1 Tax=Arsukibacterium sp. TaxID=1977258 RepID=UPI003561D755